MVEQLLSLLKYKIIDTKNIDFTVLNVLLLVVAFVFTSVFLRFIRKIVTRNLPVADKNKFISVFQFV